MKLYRISQSYNNDYDTFDSAIVSARNHIEARAIIPSFHGKAGDAGEYRMWAHPGHVKTEYIGMAKTGTPAGKVILASFNAG